MAGAGFFLFCAGAAGGQAFQNVWKARFAGRRRGKHYALSRDELLLRYGSHMKEYGEVDPALAPAMGDEFFIACFDTEEEVYAFYREAVRA